MNFSIAKIFAIMLFIALMPTSAKTVTGTGLAGASVLPSVLSLSKQEAVEFCARNDTLPNCDVIIANDTKDTVEIPNHFNASFNSDDIKQDDAMVLENLLTATEYPVRMVNFE